MNNKCTLVALLALGSFSVSHSISQEAAYGLGAVTGGASAIAAYRWSNGNNYITIPVGLCATYLGSVFFSRFTPQGRLKRAQDALTIIESNVFAKGAFRSSHDVVNQVKSVYISEWPLISAYYDLKELVVEAHNAIDLAVAAKQESFVHRYIADRIIADLRVMSDNMAYAVKAIQADPNYHNQLKLQKEDEMRKKELAVRQSQADAQWSQANAMHRRARAEEQPKQVFVQHTVR